MIFCGSAQYRCNLGGGRARNQGDMYQIHTYLLSFRLCRPQATSALHPSTKDNLMFRIQKILWTLYIPIITSLQDAQYFSDSEHQMNSGGWAQYRGSLGGGGAGNQGDMHRRMRNRTLTGLESMRGMGGMDHLRPASAQGRPITPSFSNEKDPGQTFIDFNPAGT